MNGDDVPARIARAVEDRNGCRAGCTDCAPTAAALLATSQHPNARRSKETPPR